MLNYHVVYKNNRLEIPEGEFLMGRSSQCHLVLDDPSVSRVHAAIVNSGGKIRVEDRQSRNGVLLNGERITKPTALQHGDKVSVGHQKIEIASVESAREADRTVGIRACDVCGSFANANEPFCAKCGSNIGVVTTISPKEPLANTAPDSSPTKRPGFKESIVMEQQPLGAMSGMALKALQVGKVDEADLLIAGALRAALTKLGQKKELSEHGIMTISKALIEYAIAEKSPSHISSLFRLHLASGRLMTRDVVEGLYNSVRKAGYLACQDMRDYLTLLETLTDSFSPGERFIHRRLQGLVKICS